MPDEKGDRRDGRRGRGAAQALRLAVFLGLLLSSGCATDETLSTPAATESAPINGTGLLWRIDRADRAPSHVFGTMHISDPRIVILPPAVEEAFEAATAVGLEGVKRDREDADIQAMLRLPEGGDLERIIGPDLFEALYRLGEPEAKFKEEVRRLRPWAAAMLVEQLNRSPSGEAVLDERLGDSARAAGKEVFGLESARENLGAYADLPVLHQIELLRATLQAIYAPPELRLAVREANIRAYLAGKTGELVRRWNAAFGSGDRTLQRFGRRLLEERSGRFVERMMPWIEKGGTFFAFGAAHLPGEDGVIALLQGRGVNVFRVY